MAGRRAVSAKMMDNETLHISNEEIDERIEAEPVYDSQIFDVPEELTTEEVRKWNELASLMRSIDNSPNSDADKDTMIRYCKSWVRYINLDKALQAKPNDKETIKLLNAEEKNLNKLGSDLMLDCVSRARIGKARNDFKKKKADPVGDIRNRAGK